MKSLHAAGLRGWQWLFLLEGLPSFFLAFATLCYLTDRPEQAHSVSGDLQPTGLGRRRPPLHADLVARPRARRAQPAAASRPACPTSFPGRGDGARPPGGRGQGGHSLAPARWWDPGRCPAQAGRAENRGRGLGSRPPFLGFAELLEECQLEARRTLEARVERVPGCPGGLGDNRRAGIRKPLRYDA